jgi:hypothetical protein
LEFVQISNVGPLACGDLIGTAQQWYTIGSRKDNNKRGKSSRTWSGRHDDVDGLLLSQSQRRAGRRQSSSQKPLLQGHSNLFLVEEELKAMGCSP